MSQGISVISQAIPTTPEEVLLVFCGCTKGTCLKGNCSCHKAKTACNHLCHKNNENENCLNVLNI